MHLASLRHVNFIYQSLLSISQNCFKMLNGLRQVKSLAQKYELLLTTYLILFIFVSSQQDCQLILILDISHYHQVSFLVSQNKN